MSGEDLVFGGGGGWREYEVQDPFSLTDLAEKVSAVRMRKAESHQGPHS
jgi:hypothetical protein